MGIVLTNGKYAYHMRAFSSPARSD